MPERYRNIAPGLILDLDELQFAFIRAPGPGGQNVNKVATAVQLRYDTAKLPADIRARLAKLAGFRLNTAGEIVIEAHATRSQLRNREAATEQLIALLAAAAIVPKRRRPTKIPFSQRTKRLESKRQAGVRKATRRKPHEQ